MTLTHPKKRLEIVIEAPAVDRLTRLLAASATGFTAFEASFGHGRSGGWSRDGAVSKATGMVMVVCVIDAGRLDPLLERIRDLLGRQIGVVSVTDVEVLRDERF